MNTKPKRRYTLEPSDAELRGRNRFLAKKTNTTKKEKKPPPPK